MDIEYLLENDFVTLYYNDEYIDEVDIGALVEFWIDNHSKKYKEIIKNVGKK